MIPLVWLVTGCSSGFGEAFVNAILARGDKIIATGRNANSRLSHLREQGAAILDLDVTASQEILDAKLQEAIAIYGHIDVLVNNAGYKDWMVLLNTNFFGSVNVTNKALPHFRSRQAGKIAFINSIHAFIPAPVIGPYMVSKHALSGYVMSLQEQVAQFGIKLVDFHIRHFRTKVLSQSNLKFKATAIEEYQRMLDYLAAVAPAMDNLQPGDPEKGVARMIDVLMQEGMAKGREIPSRVPIGSDAVQIMRDFANNFLNIVDEWEDLSASTDRDGPKEGVWAGGA